LPYPPNLAGVAGAGSESRATKVVGNVSLRLKTAIPPTARAIRILLMAVLSLTTVACPL
jgi:hypothetical protein